MDRRRLAPLIAAAVVAVVSLVLLLRGGDDDGAKPRARLADPITFLPADADAIIDIDLSAPLPAVAFGQLLPARLRAELPHRGRGVIAVNGARRWLAFPGKDRVEVVGPAAGVRASRAAFERRVASVPRRASVRAAFRPQALLRRLGAGFATSPWGSGQFDGAAALVVRGDSAVLTFRLRGRAEPDAVPIAPGSGAPTVRGSGPIVVAVRDPARLLHFVRDAGMFPQLDVLDRLPGFLKPDLQALGADGTVVSDGRGAITVRVEPDDPGDWSRKLNRFDALSGLARRLGLADVRIDREGDAYRIEEHDRFALRIGVLGNALVLSNRETTDLRAAASARTHRIAGRGGLVALLEPQVLLARLGVELPFGLPLGPLSGWVRASPTTTTGELRLAVRR